MGSVLERPKGSGNWYIKWTDGAGVPRRKAVAARTKKDAETDLAEEMVKADRQRRGMEPLPVKPARMTLGELSSWWLKDVCSPNSRGTEAPRLNAHIIKTELGQLELRVITPDAIQTHLKKELRDGKLRTGASYNKLRGTLLSIFKAAIEAKHWGAANPVKLVKREKVRKKKHHPTLREHEVSLLLAHVPEEWRNLFATAIYLALRKGELCGLRKSNVDLAAGEVWVVNSYEYDTTKGGHEDLLPIPKPLEPFLRDALARSPSGLVFPWADGSMRSKDSDPHLVLRTALGRAGIVDGYRYSCRRCQAAENKRHAEEHPGCKKARCPKRGVGYVEMRPDARLLRCPACEMTLWVQPVPRPLRFHDLRHTTATLLIRAKVPMAHVQRILRHANITTTIDTYGHLDLGDLREGVEKIAPLSEENARQLVAVHSGPAQAGPNGGQHMEAANEASPMVRRMPKMSEGLGDGRTRDRTWDTCRVKAEGADRLHGTAEPSGGQRWTKAEDGGSQQSPAVVPVGPLSAPNRGHLRALTNPAARLLTVDEVAERLNVSTTTVRRLCATGELSSVRILSNIRVNEEDLEKYVLRGGGAQ